MSALVARLVENASWWDALGYAGQVVFFSRFLVQWLASERAGRSVVPVAFWWLSIVGSLMCLAYALTTFKLPFILAYAFNCIPYTRNLVLIRRAGAGAVACEHADPVVAVCRSCGAHGCATCARAGSGVCPGCVPA